MKEVAHSFSILFMVNRNLISQIREMFTVDQGTRKLAKPGKGPINFLVYAVDIAHNYRLWKIIREFGYPTINTIGKSALHRFFLLIQHQDFDSKLQECCLRKCDFTPIDQAFLFDRLLVKQGKKQIYGTQFRRVKNKLVPFSIYKQDEVNTKRKSIGLEPLEEYSNSMNQGFRQLTRRKKISLWSS